MPLEFVPPADAHPNRVVLFPGTWNPPTVAHVEIARAALEHGERVIWVLPRALPHKVFDRVGFEQRLRMLRRLTSQNDRFVVATSSGGLYLEIAEEARSLLGESAEIKLVMGRDAAERIASWDYGRPGVFDAFVAKFPLLVAARNGEYVPAPQHTGRIEALAMGAAWDEVSSTEVRRRIEAGELWHHLVPSCLTELIDELY